MTESILVYAELQDGAVRKTVYQALGEARRLADGCGAAVEAVVLGPKAANAASSLFQSGADEVWIAQNAELDSFHVETHANVLGSLLAERDGFLMLFPNTAQAKDLAPRLAQRLEIAMVADVTETHPGSDSGIEFTRPIYAGKAFQRVAIHGTSAIVTLRANSFAPVEADDSRSGEVAELSVAAGPTKANVRDRVAGSNGEVDLPEADVIVSGGFGLGGPEGFDFIRPLAEALGAGLGASRAAVNAGWIDVQHQVGQTGKTVSPSLYIACGISGQIQHLAGMSSSKNIVAINSDPDAPIFKAAHYGLVGDLFEVVPQLIEEIQQRKRQ